VPLLVPTYRLFVRISATIDVGLLGAYGRLLRLVKVQPLLQYISSIEVSKANIFPEEIQYPYPFLVVGS
jgi:hypothetical protein